MENSSFSNRKLKEQVEKYEGKITLMKLFQNMVIHDLRSPAESIHTGLKQAKQMFNKEIDIIL